MIFVYPLHRGLEGDIELVHNDSEDIVPVITGGLLLVIGCDVLKIVSKIRSRVNILE